MRSSSPTPTATTAPPPRPWPRWGAPVWGCAPLVVPGNQEAGFDTSYAPDRVLADGETIEAGGVTLEAVHTPGHTSNHLCFAWGTACSAATM
jgi:glyoxylase-like metal-dependent hydrolase (beta-lactamase superfamily II)